MKKISVILSFIIFLFLVRSSVNAVGYCNFSPEGANGQPYGDVTLSTECVIYEAVNGVANGNLTLQNASIVLNSTLVFSPGKQINIGPNSYIAINTNGSIQQSLLCIKDADGDGFADVVSLNVDPASGLTLENPITQIDKTTAPIGATDCATAVPGYVNSELMQNLTMVDADPTTPSSTSITTSDRELLHLGFMINGVTDALAAVGDIQIVDKNLLVCVTGSCTTSFSNPLTGNVYVSGNVGIGSTNPNSRILIKGSATTGIDSLLGLSNSAGESLTTQYDEDNNYWKIRAGGVAHPINFSMYDNSKLWIGVGGNIGIGTTTPGSKLDVNGTVTAPTFSGALSGNATTASNADLLDSINSTSFLRSDTNGTFTGQLSVPTANRSAGIYGAYDSTKIGHVWSMGTGYKILDDGSTFGNLYGMAYCHTNNPNCQAGYSHQIDITQNGVIGIALGMAGKAWFKSTVTAPTFVGNLIGDAASTDGYSFNQALLTTSSPSFNTVYASNWLRPTGATGLYFESYARGLWAPDAGGSPYGNVQTYGSGRGGWTGYASDSRFAFMSNGTAAGIHDTTNSWLVYSPGNGNVAINGTAASYTLQVTGSLYAGGSSREYKKNIIPMILDSSKIYQLEPVTYDYKEEYKDLGKTLSGGRQIGLIAEDVYEVYPELTLNDGVKNIANVDYEKLGVLLLAEMKKHKKDIDALKVENQQLKDKLNSIELRLQKLERLVK